MRPDPCVRGKIGREGRLGSDRLGERTEDMPFRPSKTLYGRSEGLVGQQRHSIGRPGCCFPARLAVVFRHR